MLLFLLLSTVSAVRVREAAPEWEGAAVMPDGSFATLSSKDFLGEWLVLFFYPLDFTFVCPTEIVAYSAVAKDVDAKIVGVSVDSKFTHLKWTQTAREDGGIGQLAIPLVSDITKDIAAKFDVLADDDLAGIAMRGTFIIDPKGVLRAFTVHDEPLGRSVAETVRAVKGLQYADSHQGEGCPANWEPGADTIKADPKDSLDFFKSWA